MKALIVKKEAELIGYIILQSISYQIIGNNNVWEEMKTNFDFEFKKKIYPKLESAEDAVRQMKKLYSKDEFEIHPVYWYNKTNASVTAWIFDGKDTQGRDISIYIEAPDRDSAITCFESDYEGYRYWQIRQLH